MSDLLQIKTVFEDLNRQFKEFRDQRDKAEKEGVKSAYFEEKMSKLNDAIDSLDKKHAAALAELKAKAEQPDSKSSKEQKDEESIKRKEAYEAYIKFGHDRLSPEYAKLLVKCEKGEGAPQHKALSSSNDSGGGYLVVPDYEASIIKTIVEFSPVRQVARVKPTSTGSSKQPKRTGTFAGQWTSEQGTRTETTGLTYGSEEIPNHELFALVDCSQQQLEDSVFNMETEINSEMGEQFGVAEGAAFISGNGAGKPEGITVSSAINSVTCGNSSSHLAEADDYIAALYKLKSGYVNPNTRWLLNRSQVATLRKLKFKIGSDNVNYIWSPGLDALQSANILGVPYLECTDMNWELATSAAAGKIVALVGDFTKGYVISDRVQISMFRDPYTQATVGNVRFIARKRVGGQVVLGEAITKLVTG